MVEHPRLAAVAHRLSGARSVPLRPVRATAPDRAPITMAVFVERYHGARTRTSARSAEWMVQRLLGDSHLALPTTSRDVLAGLAAASLVSLDGYFADKARICREALAGVPGYVVRVPSVHRPDVAGEEVARAVGDLLAATENGVHVVRGGTRP
jgi:hypothetical protein